MSEYYKDGQRYEDILYLPHHQSTDRPHMSLHDRAAQFSPFAALTGHKDAIEETARLTEEEITLDETKREQINEALYEISQHLSEHRRAAITYFKPDVRKSGGSYLTDIGTIKKIDETEQMIVMDSGIRIPMQQIVEIEKVQDMER